MPDFYIQRIIARGTEKQASSIELIPGLNIICGPSDTGKSYVLEILDYLFGSDRVPVDIKHGYDSFAMVIQTAKGTVTVTRDVEDGEKTTTAEVSSSDDRIESGTYRIKTGKRNLNDDLWLKIIGIKEHHNIVSNQKGDTRRFTLRSFIHTMLVKEEQIIQRESILLPQQKTASTAYLSGLYFLMTGDDFDGINPRVQKAIKEARKQAIISYIQTKIASIEERKKELSGKIPGITFTDIKKKTQEIVSEIQDTEKRITNAIEQSKQLLDEIYSVSDQITECEHLLDRQKALKSQYLSDIRRIGFIVDGGLKLENVPRLQQCPICHNDIDSKGTPAQNYREASEAELTSIKLRIKDVLVSENEIVQEIERLQSQLNDLMSRREKTEGLIHNQLKPKLKELTQAFQSFQYSVEIEKEKTLLEQDETALKAELFQKETEKTDSDTGFDIKTHFTPDIMSVIDSSLKEMLADCNFDLFRSVWFDVRSAFDVVIDGKTKGSYGKGYRAFINSIVSLSFLKYLSEQGKYNPGLLAIDSPILSLKEAGNEKASDTMKASLFSYLVNHQRFGQLIILENDIPDIDYKDANIIRFTKNKRTGRAGLLYEV